MPACSLALMTTVSCATPTVAIFAPCCSAMMAKLERLDSTRTVVGLFKDCDCSMAECSLLAGDILALYTDGITESFNGAGEEFGEQRLIEALRQNQGSSPQALVDSIVD
jgi:serine phosphatase RsbU (regulator of sigma subunit)